MSETQRSQQQLFAAQALASSESLLETAIAQIDSVYSGQDIAIDAAFWRNASNNQCPTTLASPQWQCLKWTASAVGTFDPRISALAWPESIDATNSFVLFVRDVQMAPHKIKITAHISLNFEQPGVGSRATVQQSLYIPISAPWTPPDLEPAPRPAPADCTPIEWHKQFGNITPAQLKAISTAQLQNGLSSLSKPSRTVVLDRQPTHVDPKFGHPQCTCCSDFFRHCLRPSMPANSKPSRHQWHGLFSKCQRMPKHCSASNPEP